MSYLNTSLTKNAASYEQLIRYTRNYFDRARKLEALGKFDEAENLLDHASRRLAQRNKAVVRLADSIDEHGFNSPLVGTARKNRFAKEVAEDYRDMTSSDPYLPKEVLSLSKNFPFFHKSYLKPISNKRVADNAASNVGWATAGRNDYTLLDGSVREKPRAGIFVPQLAQVRSWLHTKRVKPMLDRAEEIARSNEDGWISI